MEYNAKIILLTIIQKNGSVNTLVKAGYSYSDIGYFCNELIESSLIIKTENRYVLTKSGEKVLVNYKENNDLKGYSKYVIPFDKYHKSTFTQDDIYIPNRL